VEDAKLIARLYSAAFDRIPKVDGLNFWIDSYESGRSLVDIAKDLYRSPEFTSKYGALSHQQYVEQLFLNVLRRPGEQGGVDFWTSHLSNSISRAKVLANFADSPENIAKTAETFADMRLVKEQWIFGHSKTTPEVTSSALNDTGITFGGNYPSGNNAGCTGATIAQQDCSHGRDVTHNDDSDGHAGFSFTKLTNDGTELPASAASWSCVKDNVTRRVWEVKTNDGGIHDKDNVCGWGGKTRQGDGYGIYFHDWDVLVDGSNAEVLCGYNNWRVPTKFELEDLVNHDRFSPAIDGAFFPNTPPCCYFWSASPFAHSSSSAWYVRIDNGGSYYHPRGEYKYVRLVRSGERRSGGGGFSDIVCRLEVLSPAGTRRLASGVLPGPSTG